MDAALAWYANSFDPGTASIRLRCLLPMARLAAMGMAVERYAPERRTAYHTVVFSKTYDEAALAEADALRRAGVRVVLDLCDNHFVGEETDPVIRERAQRLERMIAASDLVIASTPVLAEQIEARFPAARGRLAQVSDYLEEPATARPTASDRLALWRLDRFLNRRPGALRLIWYGNHGAGGAPAGMSDLLKVRQVLKRQAEVTPLTLTVMSNAYRKYLRLLSGWRIPTTYLPWTIGRADAVLRRHEVALIPVTQNAFTVGKTINRPATAIMAGLGVVADAIPSYEELRPFVWLDDWPGGLTHYAATRPAQDPSLQAARAYLAEAYRPEAITERWRALLTR